MAKKRGPKVRWAEDADGNPVVGLRVQPAITRRGQKFDRFYFLEDNGSRVYFGNSHDRATAVASFRRWQAVKNRDEIAFWNADVREDGFVNARTQRPLRSTAAFFVSEAAFYAEAREQFERDPVAFAQKMGKPQIAYCDRLKKPLPSRKLTALIRAYAEGKQGRIGPREIREAQKYWREFIRIVGVKYARDLDREKFRKYCDAIESLQAKKRVSAAWRRTRFIKIRAIIRWALDQLDLRSSDAKALRKMSVIKLPQRSPVSAVAFEVEEYHTMLNAADDFDKAVLLLALNGAFKPIDIHRLQWDMINLTTGSLRFDRTKAAKLCPQGAVPRVAVLWPRTIEALKRLPRRGPFVFTTAQGTAISRTQIGKRWRKLRERAGLQPRQIHGKLHRMAFENLRDSAISRALGSENPVVTKQQVDVLAGHATLGITACYLDTCPLFTRLACIAIEKFYFGAESFAARVAETPKAHVPAQPEGGDLR